MSQACAGNRVKVHYTGTFDDGSQFDSSAGQDPLEFLLGGGEVIPGFDQAVIGMVVGERKQVRIAPVDAYGEYDVDQLAKVERFQLPEELDLSVGTQLQMETAEGIPLVVTVVAVDEEHVTLDGNHPLAGQALNFELELVEICSGGCA
ncbi:MAG: peptidylprolyl isomerase [Desulfuromonadaceae bacterium]|nr:peptidylprolyl isomerase [Desulfuromonadaceae bacterium]